MPNPAARRSSISDIARLARVSVGTASHLVNRPECVAEATHDRVLEAIGCLANVLNGSARHLSGVRVRGHAVFQPEQVVRETSVVVSLA